MPYFSVRYNFTQSFSVPPEDAYKWCTDYRPDDYARMGERGKRRIKKITDDTIILDDTVYRADGKPVVKLKLVRLDPVQFSWSSIHLKSPIKYSQFLYKISPDGANGSKLEFTGLQVERSTKSKKGTPEQIASLERKYIKEDSAAWRNLAAALEKDIGKVRG